MATLEKLVKALECLKLLQLSPQLSDDPARVREKICHCVTIADTMCQSGVKGTANFSQLLSITIELFLQLCDDQHSDVRMIADESLNRIIRAMADINIVKILLELHKEIKKNGTAKCLRAALWRFAELCHMIRPQKGKPYVLNLVPCIINIAQRTEESVLETLASAIPKIFKALGSFTSDNDVKNLLKVFLQNLSSNSAVVRRTAASSILTVCIHCRKPHVFISYTLNFLMDCLVPVRENQHLSTVLGVLGCLRIILPHSTSGESMEDEMRGSFGVKKRIPETPVSVDRMIQVYELCLYYTNSSDHNVVNAALETLHQLLQNPPHSLLSILLCKEGISRSHIEPGECPEKLSRRSLSQMSVAPALAPGDETTLLDSELDAPDLKLPSIEKWVGEAKSVNFSPQHIKSEDDSETVNVIQEDDDDGSCPSITDEIMMEYSNMKIGKITEDQDSCSDTISNSTQVRVPVIPAQSSIQRDDSREELGQFSSSPSPTTNQKDVPFEVCNIGTFTDSDIPLLFCVRHLASSFLLTGSPGHVMPDKNVRVSVKALALSCISCVVRHLPGCILLPLDKSSQRQFDIMSSQLVSDVLLYSEHPDPQLRAFTRTLIGFLIKSALIRSGKGFKHWLESEQPNHPMCLTELMNFILKGLEDKSSICCRQTLIALGHCLTPLLESSDCQKAFIILKSLPAVAENSYWLVKVTLVEIVAELPFITIHYATKNSEFQDSVIHSIVLHLLEDEDARVRHAASEAVIKLVDKLFFPIDHPQQDSVIAKGALYTHLYLNYLLIPSGELAHNPSPYKPIINSTPFPFSLQPEVTYSVQIREACLSRLINLLCQGLLRTSKCLSYGCCEALCKLSVSYATTLYPRAWNCILAVKGNSRRPSSKKTSQIESTTFIEVSMSPAAGLLTTAVSLLTSSPLALDLSFQMWLVQLAGNLFAGLSVYCIRPVEVVASAESDSHKFLWSVLNDKKLCVAAEQLLVHIAKVLNIFVHVLEEITPSTPTPRPALPSLPTAPSLSPIKRKGKDGESVRIRGGSPSKGAQEKDDKFEEKKSSRFASMGLFATSLHYWKLYETVKSAYTNYKITLDIAASEKFTCLLKATLETLSQILEIATVQEVGRIAEEILSYLRLTVIVTPNATVKCVQQLLKCLFGTNVSAQWEDADEKRLLSTTNSVHPITSEGFYNICFQAPYGKLKDFIASPSAKTDKDEITMWMNYLRRKGDRKITLPFKQLTRGADKDSLASYIRLFEPMVIKALKQYTVTSDVHLQCQVLLLLSQLVQLRVNYCLLDSDQIFIDFVLKQFEFIEQGQIPYAEDLIPRIFYFLVNLSYEKQHSKSIIGIPKVIQLCDGLMASGQSPVTHCIPALIPIVEDVFLLRGNSSGADLRELDTQREVILSMLLRLVEYHQVLELLVLVLSERETEERWRRWSRQIVDTILPMMANGRMHLESRDAHCALSRVFASIAPSVLRPVDQLLRTLFAAPPNLDASLVMVERWLGSVLSVLLLLLAHGKEEAVLARLEELKFVPPPLPTCDPLNAGGTIAIMLSPDQVLARLLLRVIDLVSSRMHDIAFTPSLDIDWKYLEEQFSHFLLYCIYMFESGSYCKVATAALHIVQSKDSDIPVDRMNIMFLELATQCPLLTFQWCYLLTLLGYNDQLLWAQILRTKPVAVVLDEGPEESECYGPSSCINVEVVRKGGSILYCDYVCENIGDAEQLTWLLVNHMEQVIRLSNEPPVQEMIAAVHRHSTASGLFVQAVGSRCKDFSQPSFVSRLLHSLKGVHPSQSGPLLLLLIPRFLDLPQLVLARQAATLASNRAELLLALGKEEAAGQLSSEELNNLLTALQHHRRHSSLIAVLKKLSMECYGLSIFDQDTHRSIHPSTIQNANVNVDKNWFLAQVKQRCGVNETAGLETAQLLSKLEYNDILQVLSLKEINVSVFKHCISLGTQLTLQAYKAAGIHEAPYNDPTSCIELQQKLCDLESPLYAASRNALLQNIGCIKNVLPRPHQVFCPVGRPSSSREAKYTSRLSDLFLDSEFWNSIFKLAPGVTCFLNSLPKLAVGSWPSVPQQNWDALGKFGILCLEAITWLITSKEEHDFMQPQYFDIGLNCAASVLQDPNLSTVLGQTQFGTWLASASSSLISIVLHVQEGKCLPSLPPAGLQAAFEDPDTVSVAHACHQMATLVAWLERSESRNAKMPPFIFYPVRSLIVSVSRLPLVNSYVATPPEVWRQGWAIELKGPAKTMVPPLPVEYLQDIELLQQLIFRVTLLGWISRQQFEETWMALLSVLNSSPNDNIASEEIAIVIQASNLAIQAITALLIQTLLLPIPGNPCCSNLVHQPRERNISKNSSHQNLKAIHELLCWGLHNQQLIGSCLKLDNVFNRGNMERLNNPHRYGYSQVSLEYLWTASRILVDANMSGEMNKCTVSSKCLEREQCLAASGLDLASCLHFLLDLYSQWTSSQSGVALRLVAEAVRSALALSDLFTERAQFQWLLTTCLELARTHPQEDDLLHQTLVLGACKAASVLGPDSEVCDKIKKLIESALKSAFLPSRISGLHGMLYLLQANVYKMNPTEDNIHILPLAVEYIQKHIYSSDSASSQSEEHQLIVWALVFYLMETVEETVAETEVAPNVLQLVLSLSSTQSLPSSLQLALFQGLERLVAVQAITGKVGEQVTKLAVERMRHSSPCISLPALQLLLSCMYLYKHERQKLNESVMQGTNDLDPELLIQAMEKTSALFDRIKKGYPFEVQLLCGVLPNLLTDFFPPSEILTKVIGEFLSPQQPHPQLLSAVVFQVFEEACQQSQLSLIQDWVVLSLSNFTQCSPVGMATWCLTCFFISASMNPWLRALFPHVQSRIGKCEYEDRKLLCITAADFYHQLKDTKQKETFVSTFQAAASQPQTPFVDLISCL